MDDSADSPFGWGEDDWEDEENTQNSGIVLDVLDTVILNNSYPW